MHPLAWPTWAGRAELQVAARLHAIPHRREPRIPGGSSGIAPSTGAKDQGVAGRRNDLLMTRRSFVKVLLFSVTVWSVGSNPALEDLDPLWDILFPITLSGTSYEVLHLGDHRGMLTFHEH